MISSHGCGEESHGMLPVAYVTEIWCMLMTSKLSNEKCYLGDTLSAVFLSSVCAAFVNKSSLGTPFKYCT